MKFPPSQALDWPLPYSAVLEIADSEKGPDMQGAALVAYQNRGDVPTIGWGETDSVRLGDTCTRDQADRWLCEDLQERVRVIEAACTVKPTMNQLGAMASLAYNVGLGWDPSKPKPKGAKDGFRQSTVLRQHNAGNFAAAARAFALWNKSANPDFEKGLTARRAREAALYLTPEPGEAHTPMPQTVEPESKLTASPIAKTGTVTASAGVVAVAAQLGEQVEAVKPVVRGAREVLVDVLGVPVEWLLPIAVIVAGVLVVQWRLRQRSEGWC